MIPYGQIYLKCFKLKDYEKLSAKKRSVISNEEIVLDMNRHMREIGSIVKLHVVSVTNINEVWMCFLEDGYKVLA